MEQGSSKETTHDSSINLEQYAVVITIKLSRERFFINS
jgi:hypothetical protein